LPWRLTSLSLALGGLNCSSLPDNALQESTELSPFRTWIVAKKAGFVTGDRHRRSRFGRRAEN